MSDLIMCLIWVPTSGKIFLVIPYVVFEISGGFQPPDAIKLSEKADIINRSEITILASYFLAQEVLSVAIETTLMGKSIRGFRNH